MYVVAISRIASILGNIVFGVYVDSNCNVPIVSAAVVLFIGGFASFFIPNTRRIGLK